MVHIRLIKENDLECIAQIYCDSYNSLDIGEHWNIQSANKLMHFFYSSQSDLFFCAESNKDIVGATVAIVKPWWDGNHLTDGEIFVAPNTQQKGIGTQLLKTLFSEAKKHYSAKSWDTFTHIIHDHPLSWYKKLGFSQISHWTMITGDIDKVLATIESKPLNK